jgi:protein TonB
VASSSLEPPPTRSSDDLSEVYADVTTSSGPRLAKDRFGCRIAWGMAVSVLVNFGLWTLASRVVRNHIAPTLPPLTFRRIILPPPPKRVKHKVTPPKPKPQPRPKPKSVVTPKPVAVVKPKPQPTLRPAAHNHVITAKTPGPAARTALAGGNAHVGQPIAQQNPGSGSDNNAPPTPKPEPTPPAPQPQPQPTPAPAPKPQAPPPPAGPTLDAQPSNQVYPDIPDELKTGDYESSVRVKVEIAADGSFSVTLLSSSGDAGIDQRVLDALKRWHWKPALQDGQPVASTERFRFNFEVE